VGVSSDINWNLIIDFRVVALMQIECAVFFLLYGVLFYSAIKRALADWDGVFVEIMERFISIVKKYLFAFFI